MEEHPYYTRKSKEDSMKIIAIAAVGMVVLMMILIVSEVL